MRENPATRQCKAILVSRRRPEHAERDCGNTLVHGKYEGTLSSIVVDGKTDTPDFRIAKSGHPVPLLRFPCHCGRNEWRHISQAGEGDAASFVVTAKGSIVRVTQPHGHDIELDVVLEHAQIEDLLRLGVRTDPPS